MKICLFFVKARSEPLTLKLGLVLDLGISGLWTEGDQEYRAIEDYLFSLMETDSFASM